MSDREKTIRRILLLIIAIGCIFVVMVGIVSQFPGVGA